jgi:hypothetical protein
MMSAIPGYHPGMGHPGAGHPMAPGMQQGPNPQGANGGMPHHMAHQMAVSAPGGQMNPAMMGAMQQGVVNPNAQFSHMNPAAAQMMHAAQFGPGCEFLVVLCRRPWSGTRAPPPPPS